jgi:hypothetical protein
LIRCEFINFWSCGIVVASTSIPETLVFGGLAARPITAATPDTPSKRASRVVRTRERRSRLIALPPRDWVGWTLGPQG